MDNVSLKTLDEFRDRYEDKKEDEIIQILDPDAHQLQTTSMQSIILPTTNFEAYNFGKNAPPDYEKYKTPKNNSASNQIFKSVEYAKNTSTDSYRILKKITALFFCSITITVILLVLMAIPVSMIVVGSLYIKKCSFQIMIPIWLIVFGALSIIKNLSTLIQRIKALNNGDSNYSSTVVNVFDSFMALFLFIWFLCGNYWVYHEREKVQYLDPTQIGTFCNKTTYLLAFWIITSIYILIGAAILLFCCTICLTIFIPTKK